MQNSSLYNAVDLKPGHVHEVVVRNDDPKSVLTWDFDVVKGFLHFTVYRTVKHVVYINGNIILHFRVVYYVFVHYKLKQTHIYIFIHFRLLV